MFRPYSPFFCPCLSPRASGGWRRRSARLLRFHCKSTGGLKEGRRGGGGGGGGVRMHGRARAVAVWTELYCPGNLSVASPRSLFQPLPPPQYSPSPLAHTQTHKHTLCTPLNDTHNSHTLSHSLSLVCLNPLLVSLSLMHPPLSPHFSQADTSRPSSLLLPAPSRSLFRLIDVIVMPARQ